MSSQESAVFEFIERVDKHNSIDDLLDDLLNVVSVYGLKHMIYSGLAADNSPLDSLVKTNRFPTELWDRYIAEDFSKSDPVYQQVLNTMAPFCWLEAEPRFLKAEGAARVVGESADHGMSDGYIVPVLSRDEWLSAVSFGGPHKLELSARERGAINLLSVYASSAIERRLSNASMQRKLTDREREVLLWTSAGKSCWDVSVILGVSEQTVRYHTAQIRDKLNASNTTHAVTRALQQGEITLDQLAESLGDMH
ncbi:helix-turn-helix transcriptional regulator [Hoeflea ulvae]|uniref:LuxR family transcriptional regulator n=1 Tax=Hoeflea ulvae TaxID=2983764 RepID=A0ABT3YHU9_9HYPH|nr:autoinducer binding domain-containing protein [Hoeflea ulvae]MCY0095470.1 LuxR family transcriptional regulator [Hoeflea ulvae]